MNMFFFKIEKEYGVNKTLLASAWTEFNAAMTVEIMHLLPEEKQVSNLHITRCGHEINKGSRAGQKCNRPAEKDTTECKRHTKSKSASSASGSEPEPHNCEHVTDVNTGKTCAHRVAVCTNHLKIYDANHPHTDDCVAVCASHLKFYDANDNYQRLPICNAITKSKKKCNRLAEESHETCTMHSNKREATPVEESVSNTVEKRATTKTVKSASKTSKKPASRATAPKTAEKTTKAKASTSTKKRVTKPVEEEEEEEIYNDIDENDTSDYGLDDTDDE